MKKYLCYDSNMGIVFYQSDSKKACEDECINRLDEFDFCGVDDLNERFVIYECAQTLCVTFSDPGHFIDAE